MDALILNGTDIRDKHFNQRWSGATCSEQSLSLSVASVKVPSFKNSSCRIQMAEKFVKAVAKPSRPDMNPIR